MLYSACVRVAKAMGYCKVITYILKSENGASLKASNFIYDGEAGGEIWTGCRKRDNGVPKELKQRWVYVIKDKIPLNSIKINIEVLGYKYTPKKLF